MKPPEVALVRPERDYRASPIEEVTLAAKADDPFGLSEFDAALFGQWRTGAKGQPDEAAPRRARARLSGTTMLNLENLKLVPGDVVGFYATAKDARSEAHTDIAFIQVDPFEREFSQSQQIGRRRRRGRRHRG